uniref:Impact RWD domain protein n=1 Tax=Nothobranchius furzeri TaxID=105023 RepID=A0A8C6VSQ2_NOTFU
MTPISADISIEEVEALSSIYGDDWCVIDEASRVFCIKISNELQLTACLQIILPADYPCAAPPIYQIKSSDLKEQEHAGESILYLWVEKIRDFLVEKSDSSETGEDIDKAAEHRFESHSSKAEQKLMCSCALMVSSSLLQVKMVLEKLYENKKIASATHNMYAYRESVGYCEEKFSIFVPCSDLSIHTFFTRVFPLQILDVRDVVVVVSRWYGGILLGPDRFKLINNCARNILVEEGYTASSTTHPLISENFYFPSLPFFII